LLGGEGLSIEIGYKAFEAIFRKNKGILFTFHN